MSSSSRPSESHPAESPPSASESPPAPLNETESQPVVDTVLCAPHTEPQVLPPLESSGQLHDRQDPFLALPANLGDDFDAQSARSEELPKYADIARERPPRYHVHARASSSSGRNEERASRRQEASIVSKKLPWIASFGLAGKFCLPELRYQGLWRIVVVYHFIAALSAVTFIARDLMLIQEWIPVLIPIAAEEEGPGDPNAPTLKSGYDPFPVMRLVFLVFWCPVSFRAFATLIQKQIVNYRITLTGVLLCYFGEIFTTIVQLTSTSGWIRRDPIHNGTGVDMPNWNAQTMLEMSLWIRLALIVGFHNVGMWFSVWAAFVLPNVNMDVTTPFVVEE